jgi:hypothetical protein
VPPAAPRHARPSDSILHSILHSAMPVLSAAPEPAAPPKPYDFTSVGRVDLGLRGSPFIQQLSSTGFIAIFDADAACGPRGRKPRPYTPPAHLAAEYACLITAMQQRVLEPCPPGFRPPFINHHFVRPKADGSSRFILDAAVPNELAPAPPPFRNHGVHICKGKARHFAYAAKLDIKHCFYNVAIEPSSRQYFCIQLADGSFWQFTRLPMGFTWSSYIVHRLLRVSLAPLLKLGLVTFYADDIVLWAHTRQQCLGLLARARALLVADGWAVNDAKTVLPSQVINILGVDFDLKAKAVRLAAPFRASLANALLALSARTHATKRTLAQVSGSVAWGAVAVPTLSPLVNPILDAMQLAGHGDDSWDRLVPVSDLVLTSLRAIALQVVTNPWCTIRVVRADDHLRYATDASSRFVCTHNGPRRVFCRALSPHEVQGLHISSKEALALLDSMDDAAAASRDALFLVDAEALSKAIAKGRSKNLLFNECCARFAAARAVGLVWEVQWIPSAANKADLPTRPEKLPPGISHPESVLPGCAPVLLPAGWSSPALRTALVSGLSALGPVVRHASLPFPCVWLRPTC